MKFFSKIKVSDFWAERIPLFTAIFLFAVGMGLITDGKKIYQEQLRLSQKVIYQATQNIKI